MNNKITLPAILSLVLVTGNLYATSEQQLKVSESIKIDAPADQIWQKAGDFSQLQQWHPAVKSSSMQDDKTRILDLGNHLTITEELTLKDDANKRLKYKIIDMSTVETTEVAGRKIEKKVLPVQSYKSIISVIGNDQQSKVTWKGWFNAPQGIDDESAKKAITAVYKGGLDNLKAMMEKPQTGAGDTAIGSNTTMQSKPVTPTPPTQPAAPAALAVSPAKPAAVVKNNNADFNKDSPYKGHLKCEGDACKIDKFLTKGFRTFSLCQVCHGIDGNGSTIAPSLLEKMKTEITYDIFIDRVSNGFTGQVGVMPPWKENPNVMKNINNLYAYLKARSDGKIPAGKLERY